MPRGVRNNNPGNIKKGSRTWDGAIRGVDDTFVTFDNPTYGFKAMGDLLQVYQRKHGLNTVQGIINRWSPASDHNSPGIYAAKVAKQMGITPNTPLNLNDPNTLASLMTYMSQYENGGDYFDPGWIAKGAAMAIGR